MAKMRAMIISKAGGKFEKVELDIPAPGPLEVRIRVEACGMCHSDAIVKGGHFPGLTLPRVPGHEIAGRIDAVGAGVTTWKEGHRVGVGWYGGHCAVCNACRHVSTWSVAPFCSAILAVENATAAVAAL